MIIIIFTLFSSSTSLLRPHPVPATLSSSLSIPQTLQFFSLFVNLHHATLSLFTKLLSPLLYTLQNNALFFSLILFSTRWPWFFLFFCVHLLNSTPLNSTTAAWALVHPRRNCTPRPRSENYAPPSSRTAETVSGTGNSSSEKTKTKSSDFA